MLVSQGIPPQCGVKHGWGGDNKTFTGFKRLSVGPYLQTFTNMTS